MKRILFIMLALLCIGGVMRADDYTTDINRIPAPAREMLKKYFPNVKVGMIKIDKHVLKGEDYDVKLANGTEVDFDKTGKWTSIDCRYRQVPDGLVVKPVLDYVKTNGNGAYITKIENEKWGYEIELSDGVEMKFNRQGVLTHIDFD